MSARTRLFRVTVLLAPYRMYLMLSWGDIAAQQCILGMSMACEHLDGDRQEYKEAAKAEASTGIQLIPDESNIYMWKAIIRVRCNATAARA